MKRRDFLKGSLALTALTGLSNTIGANPMIGIQNKRPIKIGFLGGSHSHGFEKARVVQESTHYELIGLVEEDEAVRKQFAKIGVRSLSLDELLAMSEVVAVESDVPDHARHAKLALSANKHVHLEKPPADTMDDFRVIIALAQERQRVLQMGYMWRYHPGINAALEAARQGWLGEVYLVRATINTTVANERRAEWGRFRGGVLFELGSHLIDPLVRLLGRPEKVTSFLKTHGPVEDGLADNTVAVFEFKRALGLVTATTLQPGAGAYRSFEILGTQGTAIVKPIEPPNLQIDLTRAVGPYAAKSQTVHVGAYRRYVGDFEALASAVRGEHPLTVTPTEDLLVQEILLRACNMY